MDEERNRLLAWRPGADGYTREEVICAVGLQCRSQPFLLSEVLSWLGAPDMASGDSRAGVLVYFYSAEAEVVPLCDVSDGRVVDFSTLSRFGFNARRRDPETGEMIAFNLFDVMGAFDGSSFK